MAEKAKLNEKTKSGAGKFFAGALIGGLVGMIASRFISVDVEKKYSYDDEFDDFDDDDEIEPCSCKKDDKKDKESEKTEKSDKKSEK